VWAEARAEQDVSGELVPDWVWYTFAFRQEIASERRAPACPPYSGSAYRGRRRSSCLTRIQLGVEAQE